MKPIATTNIKYAHHPSERLTKTFFILLAAAVVLSALFNIQQLLNINHANTAATTVAVSTMPKPDPAREAKMMAPPPSIVVDSSSENEGLFDSIVTDENTNTEAVAIEKPVEKVEIARTVVKRAVISKEGQAFLKENDIKNLDILNELSQVTELHEYHFKKSSSELDAKADVAKLDSNIQRYISTQDKWSKIIILGFTDNRGSKLANVKLGLKRAEGLKSLLVNKGIAAEKITVASFGPELPIGSNDDVEGRTRNRRVELNLLGSGAQ